MKRGTISSNTFIVMKFDLQLVTMPGSGPGKMFSEDNNNLMKIWMI